MNILVLKSKPFNPNIVLDIYNAASKSSDLKKINVKFTQNIVRNHPNKKYNLNKLNLYVTKEFVNGFTLSLRGENLTDEVVEVVPFYNTEGREIYLTLGYTW